MLDLMTKVKLLYMHVYSQITYLVKLMDEDLKIVFLNQFSVDWIG